MYRPRLRASALLLVMLALLGLPGLTQELPEIKFEKFVLSNGLQVILHEDHAIPVVSVNVWYHVGSKNEKPGRTGFAHLFEHLMFEGSANAPEGMFDKWLEAAGGNNNGSTTEDRTNYYEDLPSNALELALWLESDRMGHLLDSIDQEKLDLQRDVVKNERRQGVDNQPYGRVDEILLEALFPSNHPYSWPVIGSMADLSAASLEDVKDFFKRYYAPNNASLCIAGDIDPAATRALVEKYFGDIPPGPPLERIEKWIPRIDSPKSIHMTDNVSLPRIYMAWHSPALYEIGDAELDILASILSSGKNSRLYKSLVYEREIAQDITAYQQSMEIGGQFMIQATAKPGHTLDELKAAIDEELARIFEAPPSVEEMKTAVNSYEASFIRRLERVGGFGGKADRLNMYNVFAGRPDFFKEDLERYLEVNPIAIQQNARRYLDFNTRVILEVVPAGDLEPAEVEIDRSRRPEPGPQPAFTVPSFSEKTLSNGLRVLIAKIDTLPLVQLNLFIEAGWAADPRGKPGVASLTSDLQDEGTANRTALQISEDLKALGSLMSTSSSFDSSSLTLNTLKKHLEASLEIFSDVLLNANFPEEELARKKKMYQARIMQDKRQPVLLGINTFMKTLYGEDHPYGQPYTGTGTLESIEAIGRSDLESFYKSYFAPNNATLVVAGDVEEEDILESLEQALADWKAKDTPAFSVPEVEIPARTRIYLVDKPGAPQSVIIAGHPGLMRNAPDYFAVEVLNTIFGGKFTSRLNMNLREEKGYTYGASSFFMYLKNLGPFITFTQVQTQFTKESLSEIIKEMKGLRGDDPVGPEELEETKKYLTLGYPSEFGTISQIAGNLGEIVAYDLPNDYFNRVVPGINAVTFEDLTGAARKHIRPDGLIIVIVGDVSAVEPGLRELELGEIVRLEKE